MYKQKKVCYVYDEPVQYKKLNIYPVRVYDYLNFYSYLDCLQIDKNSVPDIKVISMSYLDYLIKLSNESNYYCSKVVFLLKLCMHLKEFAGVSEEEAKQLYENGETVLLSNFETPEKDEDISRIDNSKNIPWNSILELIKEEFPNGVFYFEGDMILFVTKKNKTFLQIKNELYSTADFDEIKQIILEQNDIEQINEKTRKEARDELDRAQALANKIRGQDKTCDFENQMICLSATTGLSLDEIKKITIRKFKKYLARVDHIKTYEVYKPSILSGAITSKDKNFPAHWMVDLESKAKYADILVDESEVKNKIEKQ